MGRVRKNPEVRRKEILNVAQQLFIDRGYANVTVEDITKEVGIARSTFYEYYTDKVSILVDLVDKFILKNSYSEPTGESTYEKLMSIARDIFSVIKENRMVYYLILKEAPVLSDAIGLKLLEWRNARYEITRTILEQAIINNEIAHDISLEDAVFAFLALVGQRSGDILLAKADFEIEQEAKKMVRLVWTGLTNIDH